ncbi:hypothetical protein HanRHA438_Chr10g0456791 [Helianthus annuus]|uniref:Uncharacterized protein n=1 Tax=Helianthus annuus TaxID=4232 RepID=A0A251TJH6_HELAN|nr:uncharacterized protein LOC110884774 isoform X1 [Helianthus annuus]KAF5786727.1 hypothetical protein HanXRQr2_Chr10g0444401 [Helianthus annuus]KAJ0514102.1 hypothetical protein HanHA300_Chr10g0365531 [Helianthus annuus]KAJ0522155.1 hypothetical protein HanIR_Chr10g0479241 [Helianthus annuus]KAJ0530220.1 hypothetical protein HanHA89_Chr10g0387131 [Helianthus annuus]KAJ0697093.1 hypothetical protein HanLR1_Chr10g0364811 [Helianthus annuus]
MSPGSASSSYGVRTFATTLIHRYRASSMTAAGNSGYQHTMFGYGSSRHHTLSFSSGSLIERPESKMEHESNLKAQPSDPDPPRDNLFSWVKWVLGSMLPIMFSFWKQKWDSMLKLEGKVEGVVKEVEEVAEVVEKVASKTEKLSAEVAERLNNGELKEVALNIEHVSNVIAKDARMTEDFIHKFGDLKQDLKDLEAMVEPVIDKMEHKK